MTICSRIIWKNDGKQGNVHPFFIHFPIFSPIKMMISYVVQVTSFTLRSPNLTIFPLGQAAGSFIPGNVGDFSGMIGVFYGIYIGFIWDLGFHEDIDDGI
jgi:hypothetical protein